MAEREYMIGKASGVGVMLFDPKLGFLIEQPIEYIGRIASGRVDRGDVIATVLIGDMRVDEHARFIAVARVHMPGRLPTAAGAKPWAVGRRRGSFAPGRGERLRVGLVAHVPTRPHRTFIAESVVLMMVRR